MPVDNSIPLRAFDNQFDPAKAYGQALQLKEAKQSMRLRDIQTEDALTERKRKMSIRAALQGAIKEDGTVDAPAVRKAYVGEGDLEGLTSFNKSEADTAKATREAKAAELDGKIKELTLTAQIAGSAKDQATYDRALMTARQMGLSVEGLPPVYNPEVVSSIRNQALTAAQQLEQEARKFTQGIQLATFNQTVSRDADTSARGWAGVQTSRMNANGGSAGGRAPSGYRYTPDGNLQAIPGGPGDKAPPPKPLSDTAVDKLTKETGTVEQIGQLLGGFKDNFSGVGTNAGNFISRMGGESLGLNDKGQADWWQSMESFDNIIRNEFFGASLTPGEQAAWERTTVTPTMDPARVKANLKRRKGILRGSLNRKLNAYRANGANVDAFSTGTQAGTPPPLITRGGSVAGGNLTKGADGVIEWRPQNAR